MITKTFDEVFSYESLYRAHLHGRAGKRTKRPVVRFELNMTERLYDLYTKLQSGTYKLGNYHAFAVYEPKKRQIQTLYYSDRVVQHVLCDQVLAPYFTRRAIIDNCVCQKGKGAHFALRRFEKMLHGFISRHGVEGYFLKCDILKYFPSIPHAQLKHTICSQILDEKLREYVAYVIDSFHTAPNYLAKYGLDSLGVGDKTERGIPIGNQSSQIFGMYYLDPVDRLAKEQLGLRVYSRYMDDFVAVHEDKEFLKSALGEIRKGVAKLGLTLNSKTQIFPLKNGVTYLGYRYHVTPTGKIIKTVKKPTKRRFRWRARLLKKAYLEGYIDKDRVKSTMSAVHGHLCHGSNVRFEREINKKILPMLGEENES
ncbi:MAG: RNA-directed DNA polymerase [Clostridiales bacterium]|nr:RNA-directed DNA polymerase [Clostridiales bacterium]